MLPLLPLLGLLLLERDRDRKADSEKERQKEKVPVCACLPICLTRDHCSPSVNIEHCIRSSSSSSSMQRDDSCRSSRIKAVAVTRNISRPEFLFPVLRVMSGYT